MFKDNDKKLLKDKNIDISLAEQQVKTLRNGFPFMRLSKAAGVGKGIKKLSETQKEHFVKIYDSSGHLRRIKFIPASGAATRMFKALFEFDEAIKQSDFDPKILNKDAYKHVKECFDRLSDFAFYPLLTDIIKKFGSDINSALQNKDYHTILKAVLGDDGLNYGKKPKGLLVFHRYETKLRTAVEEHLVEGAGYAVNNNSEVNIHLTVSPEHQKGFEDLMKNVQKSYEDEYKVNYNIAYSVQKSSTDTLAIDKNGEPFRESNGSLTFRPGGHGALLENLNDIDGDLIFIKNIDNVSYEDKNIHSFIYKKMMGGMLIHYQKKVFDYIRRLEKNSDIDTSFIKEVRDFLHTDLGVNIPLNQLENIAEASGMLTGYLNRPIRVCGMVVNSGEPGGGPFWALGKHGKESLQIVEKSQVDHHDPEQEAILNSASHFNPVDMVCGIKDSRGNKFDLLKYRDPNTGFISKKFKSGKPLKALELPGLWNGSMSDWNTIFVEVPAATFSPVKTMHDLLRPEHQQKL